ncbi:hypothetical protein [Cellulosimicrobium cellulans]|uniref:hypothetical protein n=1 Tax=Cellulosimicrobium cellulans TaxID=1710 RepID=UPI001BAD8F05|nr:hypothetical protein [Cellulosimicrobium cellulans]QUC01238.1 hypothetical protein J5A69_08775 [Cellulosimicrobium cellulans]
MVDESSPRRQSVLSHLWGALNLRLSEILQLDFWLGIVGGLAFFALGYFAPDRLFSVVAATTEIVGVMLGAVLAAVALLATFYDQAFLRKLRRIGRDPVRYLAPFLFTLVTGVIALLGLLGLAALESGDARLLLGGLGLVVGFFAIWTLASLLPLMATLVQFINLKVDALDVPDDVDIAPRRKTGTDI